MGSGREYLAAFAALHAQQDADERRRTARQGLAVLAQIAAREPAPLEGLASDMLLLSVRAALQDGVLGDLEWMSPAAAAIALFELAQALPAGAERRELGRRVLVRLRDADRETFVRLVVALARSSPRLLRPSENARDTGALRARVEVVLAAPLTAPTAVGELAIGLLAQPQLAQSWVEVPATGSLPGRRLAARILAHGAREAMVRHASGDRGGAQIFARPGIRAALARLLGDREALVWRFAGIARGLLAHVDSEHADDIDRELRPSASNFEHRRAAASAAAALEGGGAAQRWAPILVARAAKEPGVSRGAILGLAGLATTSPDEADRLAVQLVERSPLESAEALADLRREEQNALLPLASEMALAWTRGQMRGDPAAGDDGRWALLHALDAELGDEPRPDGVGILIANARRALDAGDVPRAMHEVRSAIDEIASHAEWLERATDDDAIDRRHSMRLLRELDRELLADNAVPAVLALAPEGDPARTQFARVLAAIEAALLARESQPETGAVAHGGLRLARLRALVRLLDGVTSSAGGDGDVAPRIDVVRTLMTRAQTDRSSLRRAIWAALTRAGDALLRDGHVELTDLLLAWTTVFPDEDFAIVREASMVPDIEAAFAAYAALAQATWAAADPDDRDAIAAVARALVELADALPPERSPRVEAVRLALARLGNHLVRLTASASHDAIPTGVLDAIATELGALARRVYGARLRLGLPADDAAAPLEAAARGIAPVLEHHPESLDESVAVVIDTARGALPPAIAAAMERVLVWLAARPRTLAGLSGPIPIEAKLPGWVPLSRLLGGFYVVRPIGRGASGSVLLAVRAEERTRADRELVAVKVPDYSAAARSLSEQEFETLFREEAGALLALPQHRNLARFITFDASAQPKPILVMEYVRGPNLERTLETDGFTIDRAIAIIDDLLAGLEAMHRANIAHLDVKPPNVVLRDGSGPAVLVDFGLAGRHIRVGCGSVYYGAAEVWSEETADSTDPFAADAYAAGCVAYEILAKRVLVNGDSIKDVLDQHFSSQPGGDVLAQLARAPRLGSLSELLRAALARDPRRRPSVTRLRAGFAAIAPELRALRWPIEV
jgi:hypothetical protein